MNETSVDNVEQDTVPDLAEVLEHVGEGIRDREASRKALERLARESEEIRQRLGTLDVAVDLVREARNS